MCREIVELLEKMDSLDGKKTAQLKWTKIELEETEDEVSVVPIIKRRDSYFTDTPTSVSSLQESISRVFGTGRMISTESFVKVEKKGKSYRRYSHEPSLLTEQRHGCESQEMKVYFLESPHGSSDGLDSIGEESVDSARETSLSSGSENDMKDLKHVPERRFQHHQLPRKEEHTYQNIREISKQRLIEQWVQSQSDCTKSSESKGQLSRETSTTTTSTTSMSSASTQSSVPVDFRCAVCLDYYKDPRHLPCGHTYCKGCIGKIVNSSSQDSREKQCFTCPSCRNIIKYGHDGIKGLPANTGLDNAVKRFKKLPKEKRNICSKHSSEKTMWCETCSETLCTHCLVNHASHTTMTVSTMKECQVIRKRLSKAKTELKSKHSSLKGSIDGIEKTRDKLDSKKAELKKKIDRECDVMIAMIEKQRKQMYNEMDGFIAKKQKRKQREIATISGDLRNTRSLLRTISDLLDTEEPKIFLEKLKTSSLSSDLSITSTISV